MVPAFCDTGPTRTATEFETSVTLFETFRQIPPRMSAWGMLGAMVAVSVVALTNVVGRATPLAETIDVGRKHIPVIVSNTGAEAPVRIAIDGGVTDAMLGVVMTTRLAGGLVVELHGVETTQV